MAHAAFNFATEKLSRKVTLDTLDLEVPILEIPSRFAADSSNVGRVMIRARLSGAHTRGGAIIRLLNNGEDAQVVRQASIASSNACVIPIEGGLTLPTTGGMRVTAELLNGSTEVIIEALVDPSTGGVPGSNPFSVSSQIPNGTTVEFGPSPMDCTRVFIQLPDAMVGASNILWLDGAGATIVSTGIPAGSSPFLTLIPAGGFHLAIQQSSGASARPIVTWS